MKHDRSHRWLVIPGALIFLLGLGAGASEFVPPQETNAPVPLVVYFDDGPYPTSVLVRDETRYVPLIGLIRRMALPYTDATALGTFTIRGPLGTLIATDQENSLTIDEQALELEQGPFREGAEWFVPIEFLTSGLERITGVDFRYQAGAPRILAGSVSAAGLTLDAVGREGETRLTIRFDVGVNVRVQQNPEENRVVLAIDHAPINPDDELLDYQDASIRSVRFEDADGRSKIVVETTSQVASVRLTPTDENRTFYVDFVPESAPTETVATVPAPDRPAPPRSETVPVIVIDPGHGGLDGGTEASGTLEKDLTLRLARNIRTRLQTEIATTVILTRDADLELSGESRSAIANNNKADLLISLHVGWSADPSESGASLFVMKQWPPDPGPGGETLFKPWYRSHQPYLSRSRELGTILQRNLARAIPGWPFRLREAPINVLTSAAMPAILIELGNAMNPTNLERLNNADFRNRLIEAIVKSVSEFGTLQAGGV